MGHHAGTDEEGVARQFHITGRRSEDHAIGGDKLDLAEDGVAIDAAHIGAGLKRCGELGFVAGSGLIDRGDNLRPGGADRRALFKLTEGTGWKGSLPLYSIHLKMALLLIKRSAEKERLLISRSFLQTGQ